MVKKLSQSQENIKVHFTYPTKHLHSRTEIPVTWSFCWKLNGIRKRKKNQVTKSYPFLIFRWFCLWLQLPPFRVCLSWLGLRGQEVSKGWKLHPGKFGFLAGLSCLLTGLLVAVCHQTLQPWLLSIAGHQLLASNLTCCVDTTRLLRRMSHIPMRVHFLF